METRVNIAGRPRTAFVCSLSSLVVLPDCNLIISLLDRGWGGRRRKSGRFKVVVKGRCVFKIENFGMGSPCILTFSKVKKEETKHNRYMYFITIDKTQDTDEHQQMNCNSCTAIFYLVHLLEVKT